MLHLAAVRLEPGDVLECFGRIGLPAEVAPAAEQRLGLAQRDGLGGERQQRLVVRGEIPVDPGDLVVLGVGVVVPVLRPVDLVAVRQHRHALRQHHCRDQVALGTGADGVDIRVVGFAFDAEVARLVVVVPVVVVLAVGLVVLVFVADKVAQGESIVRHDEVDAGARSAARLAKDVRRARHAVGEIGPAAVVAQPPLPHAIAKAIVPFRPQGGEMSGLVAARANIPGFGDELDGRQNGILMDGVEKAAARVEGRMLAPQRDGQVESEAIDVHFLNPVAEAVQGHFQHLGLREVERVAGTGEVDVPAPVVGQQPVVAGVVGALPAQRWTEVIALAGVVVDDVEDDLDAGRVQFAHHPAKLADLHQRVGTAGVPRLRRKEVEGAVPPIVGQVLFSQERVVDKGVDGQQLDGGDAETGQVLDAR